MAEMIPVVEQTGAQSWSNTFTLPGRTDALQFKVVGGTFDDDSTEKSIEPVSGNDFTVALKADVTVDASATQSVLLYYQDGALWFLVPEASRIFTRPQEKELDYRLVTKGMDAMPLGASLNPTYNGMVVGGGVRIPTAQSMQQSVIAKISQLRTAPFDPTKNVSFVYDRVARTLYYLHTDGDVFNTTIFGKKTDVDIAGYRVDYGATGLTGATIFYESGLIEVFDASMNVTVSKQLPYKLNRVVCRRILVGTNSSNTFVAFDTEGKAHYLRASLGEASVKSDQFYVNASDSYDVLMTLDGKLVGSTVSNAPANVFWYQFVPSSLLALGHDGTNIYQFNIRDNVMNAAPRPLVANDLVVFNTTADWTQDGGKRVAGMDTNGSDALFNFADAENPTQTRNGWPYIELFTAPYKLTDTYDRLFYYAARPTTNLKHLAIRKYQIVWPDLTTIDPSDLVSFSLVVNAADPDVGLPITAPEGVTVLAQVDGVPVTRVYDGQTVNITLSGSFVTSSSFPISIGRSVYQFEMKANDLPFPYEWKNILGVDNDTWNRTEDVLIEGINMTVPVKVLLDGEEDYDRVKIYVDGVETPSPAFIRVGQTLGFDILQANNTTRVEVNVGAGTSRFGIYTIVEAKLDVGRHWAYMPAGKQIRSDVMRNTGTVPLTLRITDTNAEFVQGGQTITVPVNGTTAIKFTPTEGLQYTIPFASEQNSYEWHVWADVDWLGETPPEKRAERYVMDDSGDIFFDNIPDNFWTYITVPAGMLLDVDGVRVEQELDSRGVYKDQGLVIGPFECADTMLKIYGLPSQDQPHTLVLGDASLGWLYNMTVDPTYHDYWRDSINLIDMNYVGAVNEAVTEVAAPTYIGTGKDLVVVAPENERGAEVPVWFHFVGSGTHAADSSVIEFMEQDKPSPQLTAGPQFVTGHKDYVDNFRMAELIDRSDIKIEKIDLFELITGKQDVPQTIPLFTFIGTDKGNAVGQFPLFELEQGTVDVPQTFPQFEMVQGTENTSQLFPLFELEVGNTLAYDDTYWPNFHTETAIKDDTFANNFVAMLPEDPQYFDLFLPEYRQPLKAKSDQIEARYVQSKGRYAAPKTEPKKIDIGGMFPQPLTQGRYIQTAGNYPQKMNEGVWSPSSEVYHVEWARPIYRPAYISYRVHAMIGKYVDPLYHPIVLFLPEIPFTRWTMPAKVYHQAPSDALRMEHSVKYPVAPAPSEFEHLKQVAGVVAVAEPSFSATSPAYLNEIDGKHIIGSPRIGTDPLAPEQVKTPRIVIAKTSKGIQTSRTPIHVEIRKNRKAENKVYGISAPVIETWTVQPNHGDRDKPLLEGYFETELLALQDATQVWGFDPSMVYAIQQTNGAWTWAQVTVCEESCGSMSCAARGYLSGG